MSVGKKAAGKKNKFWVGKGFRFMRFVFKSVRLLRTFDFCNLAGSIAYNVLGIAEGGEIEAISFDFAPRRAKTNFYEINLKIKNE